MSEQPIDSTPSALLPAAAPSLEQDSKPRSDNSLAGSEEIPPPEDSCMCLLTTETEEDASTEKPASLELPSECVSSPSMTQGFEQEVAVGLSERVEGFSEGADMSAAQQEGSTSALLCPVAESQASLGAEGEAPPSPELTEVSSVSTGGAGVSQNSALPSVSAREETEDAARISPDTLLENEQNTLSEVLEPQFERDVNRNLMPSFVFLSGVVSLSIVLQEPSALFLIGLLLVLRRL